MRYWIALLALALSLAGVVHTQEATPEAEANTGATPTINNITPDELTIVGSGFDVVEVTYTDSDGDANRFIWRTDDAEAARWFLPDSVFTQAAVGTTIPVRFNCDNVDASVDIALIVADAAGNQSIPATLRLNCVSNAASVVDPDITATPVATPTPAAEATDEPATESGSRPQIRSLEPSAAIVLDGQSVDVELVYDDPDGHARALLFSTVDEGDWTLPPTNFVQAVAGTTIPLNFFCADVFATLPVDIQIVVVDEANNISAPATFRLTCLPATAPAGSG